MKTHTLWAPNRLGYLQGLKRSRRAGRDLPCFLCAAVRARRDDGLLVVERGRHALCVLNKYPYNIGHLMIVPKRHTRDFAGLKEPESREMDRMLRTYVKALKTLLDPDGFNIGINLGAAAGAGLATHLHWHVVPRWASDTNFATVVGGTRVISMTLADLLAGLRRVRGLK